MSQSQTAVVDTKSIYLGMYDEGASIPDGARRISEITECDLEPGRYYWNGVTFLPRERGSLAAVREEPNLVAAIYDAFMSMQRQGLDLPQSTREWMAYYASSVDNSRSK